MRMVISAERLDKVIQAFEDDSGSSISTGTSSKASAASASSSSSSRNGSPAVEAIKAVSTLAKKVVQASVDAVVATPAAAAAAPAVVAPTPIRGGLDHQPEMPPAPQPDSATAQVPLSPFTQVKPHALVPGSLQAARRASFAAAAAASCGAEDDRSSPVGGSGSVVEAFVGLVGNFPFAVGACLLACGLSQAGIEWYTT